MFEFIVLLRAISAVIITNAHYENIYPLSIIANGGLLGDVMFFAISGFCLYKPQMNFLSWYKKRLIRIYPVVWMITLVYTILGYYSVQSISDVGKYFIFPTHYHFIGSIILLYIPFYFISYMTDKIKMNETRFLLLIFMIIFILQAVIYILLYDKSTYHIDSVYEPMIRLLFLEAMLIGMLMRVNVRWLTVRFRAVYAIASVLIFILYFVFKICMTRATDLVKYQIFNQYILLLLLTCIFITVGGLENKIHHIPEIIYIIIKYVAKITLEIYLVQYALIHWLNIGPFPLNFIIVTVSIVVVASVLRKISQLFIRKIEGAV